MRIKLLAAAGVLPFTQHRLEAVLRHIFNRPLHLGNGLNVLAEQAFLRRPVHDPIQPEPAYLQGVVTYREGKTPTDDFLALAGMLKAMSDAEGLFYIGVTFVKDLRQHQQALTCFEAVLQLQPDHPHAWNNKGTCLDNLERHEEALAAYDRALQLQPDHPAPWHNKGICLSDLGRHADRTLRQANARAAVRASL